MTSTFGTFHRAENGVLFDPNQFYEQLMMVLPDCELTRSQAEKGFKQQPFTMNASAGSQHRLNPVYLPDVFQKAMYQPRVVLQRIEMLADQDADSDAIDTDPEEISGKETVGGNNVVAVGCINDAVNEIDIISLSSDDSDGDSAPLASTADILVLQTTTDASPPKSTPPITTSSVPNELAIDTAALECTSRRMLLSKISENFKTQEQLIVERNNLLKIVQNHQKAMEESATQIKNLQYILDAAEKSNNELKKDIDHMQLEHVRKIKIIKLDSALQLQTEVAQVKLEYGQKIKEMELKVRKEADLEHMRVLEGIENACKQARSQP